MRNRTTDMVSALDNFPILRQLNAAKVTSLKACCTILLTGIFLAAAAALLLNVNTALPHFSTDESQFQIRIIPPFILIWSALQISLYYALSQTFDSDMHLLNEKYPLQPYLQSWAIPRLPNVVMTLGLYALLVVCAHIFDFERWGFEPHLRFLDVLNEGSAMISIWYFFLPIISLLTSTTLLGFLKQAKILSSIATDIPINLYRLEIYQLLANMLTRITIGGLFLMSFIIAIVVFIDTGLKTPEVGPAALFVGLSPLLVAFGYPIWIIRCRTHEKKTHTIEHILNEVDDLDLAIESDRTQHAYLLTQQMFIESRSEWPIASHVRKLILFGMLPPLTWVLAAMIENSIY
jgi:hypothetical protein